jgi:hypothetical protein
LAEEFKAPAKMPKPGKVSVALEIGPDKVESKKTDSILVKAVDLSIIYRLLFSPFLAEAKL